MYAANGESMCEHSMTGFVRLRKAWMIWSSDSVNVKSIEVLFVPLCSSFSFWRGGRGGIFSVRTRWFILVEGEGEIVRPEITVECPLCALYVLRVKRQY